MQNFRALGLRPQTPKQPPPHCGFLATRLNLLRGGGLLRGLGPKKRSLHLKFEVFFLYPNLLKTKKKGLHLKLEWLLHPNSLTTKKKEGLHLTLGQFCI